MISIKTNGLKYYAIIIMALMFLCVESLYGEGEITDFSNSTDSKGKPYYADGKWYSLYYHGTNNITIPKGKNGTTDVGLRSFISVYPPCTGAFSITFYKSSEGHESNQRFAMAYNDKLVVSGDGKPSGAYDWATGFSKSWVVKNQSNSWSNGTAWTDATATSGNQDSPLPDLYKIQFHHTAATNITANSISVELAKHIRFDDGSTCGTRNYTYDLTGSASTQQTITIPFRSFLLNNDHITIKKITSDPNDKFRVKDYNGTEQQNATTVNVAQFTTNATNICGVKQADYISGGDYYGSSTNTRPGNASDKNIQINYYPNSDGVNYVTFEIYDGDATGTAAATVTIVLSTANSNGAPYYENGTWYSLYQRYAADQSTTSSQSYSVYPPNEQSNNYSIDYYKTPRTEGDTARFWITEVDKQYYTVNGLPELKTTANYTINQTMATATTIKIERINNSKAEVRYNNMHIKLANHILFENSSTGTSTYSDNTYSSSPVHTGEVKEIQIPFRSFLLANNCITVKMTSNNNSDAEVFRIKDKDGKICKPTGDVVVAEFAQGNVCGIKGGTGSDYIGTNHIAGNATDKDIIIYYYPTSTDNQSATFSVYDGTNTSGTAAATITVTAKGVIWNSSANNLSDGKPYYCSDQKNGGDKWFSLFCNYTQANAPNIPAYTYDQNIYDVFSPCKTNTMTVLMRKPSSSYSGYYYQQYKHLSTDGWTSSVCWNAYNISQSDSWHVNEFTFNTPDIYQIKFTNDGGYTYVINNIQFELDQHVRIASSNSEAETRYGTIHTTKNFNDIQSTIYCGDTVSYSFNLRSFLTTTNLTMKIMAEDSTSEYTGNAFQLVYGYNNNDVDANGRTVITSGANVCGFPGGMATSSSNAAISINTTGIPITINYTPTVAGNDKATLVLYDNGVKKATVSLTATATKRAQTVTWNQNNITGNYESLKNTTTFIDVATLSVTKTLDDTDLPIVYSTTDASVADFVRDANNEVVLDANGKLQLKYYNAGDATIKATQAGDDATESAEKSFTVHIGKSSADFDFTDTSKSQNSVGYSSTVTYQYKAESSKSDGNVTYSITDGTDVAEITSQGTDGALVTTKKAGSFIITATLAEGTNYLGGSEALTVSVSTVDPTIAFNSDNPTSIDYTTKDAKILATSNSDGAITYSIVDGAEYADIDASTGVVTPKEGGKFTVKASQAAVADKYNSKEITTEYITINDTQITISTDGFNVANSGITSASYQLALQDALTSGGVTSNYDDVVYTVTGETSDRATVSGNSITAYQTGSYTLHIIATSPSTATNAVADLTIDIPYGTMTYNYAGDWTTQTNWSRADILPTEYHNVQINANCVIPNESTVIVHDVTLGGGILTVSEQSALQANSIENTVPAKLVLSADDENSASVLFTSGTNPKATVECYFKGTTNPETGTDGKTYDNPDWQYRGFIGNPDATTAWTDVYVYEWSEGSNGWDENNVTNGNEWTGYAMANMNENCTTKTYTTTLLPTNVPKTLSLAKSTTGKGLNVYTNSFSAPVKISEITCGTNVEHQIVFFKTTNYKTVKDAPDSAKTIGDNTVTSLYVTCPIHTSSVTSNVTHIPAGQSFFCFTKGTTENTLTLPDPSSDDNVGASGAMYAPREQEEFNVLKIYAESENERDEVYLVESDRCSHNYDDGYDGTKYFTDGMGQIYGKNDFGKTFIAADSSMLGQMIGFRAGSNDMTYTLRFDIDRLSGYDELYLYDRVTKRYTNILDGGTYTFTGSTEGEDERFQIIGRMEDSDSFVTGADHAIEVVSDRALLKGFDSEDEIIYLTDLKGTILWQDNAKNGPWFNLPTNIASGLYIIHCGDATAKYLAK